MQCRQRILQANLNNLGGAFSVAYEAQKELQKEYIFDYFFPDKFIENDVYRHLIKMGSKCTGDIECKNRMFKQFKIYQVFKSYLKRNDYEYVHIHSDTAWKIALYYLAAKFAGIENIVVHSHSSGINGHYRFINYFLHLIAKPIIRKAKYKCACSDIAAIWMFNSTDNVTIIRNGVDLEKYAFEIEKRNAIRTNLQLEGKIVIGSVSDYSYQKNPEFLLKLIESFKYDERYVFLLVGNRENCKLKELIDNDSSIRSVKFTGMVTRPQDYLCAMDIFVLPSRFEGLPMCALEAQVNGLYTIVSDKVTDETRCSKYFARLELDVQEWKKEIMNVNLAYSRFNREDYLNYDKASSSGMAEKFRRIYKGETIS